MYDILYFQTTNLSSVLQYLFRNFTIFSFYHKVFLSNALHFNEVNYHDKFAKVKMIIILLSRNDNSATPRMIANFLRIWHKKRNCQSSFFFWWSKLNVS